MNGNLNSMSNDELLELLGQCVRRDKDTIATLQAELAKVKKANREMLDELQARDTANALADVRGGRLP